jgi:hypothetical protein
MLLGLWPNYWDDWLLYHKCNFDGINKLIIVHSEVSTIDVKIDIYSDWKEWVKLRDNSKFLPAIRTIGGDPVGGGIYAGDIYFLMNNWRIYIDHTVEVNGVIYSDNSGSPFVVPSDTYITSNKVSNLVQTVTTGGGSAPTAEEVALAVWSLIRSAGTTGSMLDNLYARVTAPTITQVVSGVWNANPTAYSITKAGGMLKDIYDRPDSPSVPEITEGIWSANISGYDLDSAGDKLNSLENTEVNISGMLTENRAKELLFNRSNTVVNKQITSYEVDLNTIVDVLYDADGIPTSETLR